MYTIGLSMISVQKFLRIASYCIIDYLIYYMQKLYNCIAFFEIRLFMQFIECYRAWFNLLITDIKSKNYLNV